MSLRRAIGGVVAVFLLVLAFASGIWVDQSLPQYVPALILPGASGTMRAEAMMDQALRIIGANYYDPATAGSKLGQAGVAGMVSALGDPFSRYLDPAAYRRQEQSLAGLHQGVIGAYVEFKAGRPVVTGIVPGSPAQAAGLSDGDVVVTIAGQDTAGLTQSQTLSLISGPLGSQVLLGVRRGLASLTISVRRASFSAPTVITEHPAPGILYIRVYQFGDRTAAEFDSALRSQLPGARGIILDLRDNGGGLVSAAQAMISRLVPSGVAFEVRGRGAMEPQYVDGRVLAPHVPLVVLVNAETASAAEIVSGSLQEHARARLVGTTTYGKGSVQEDFSLQAGGDLHLTVEHWFLPGGRSIDHVGLTPEVAVAEPAGDLMYDPVGGATNADLDAQMAEALRLLSAG
ncbi:MAG TPA: S41 family peptidase [Candidatus Nitrosotalea sp.]|nr:S41 family peptidase [Candidatus Nitrosotalea sp.]